MEYVNFILCVAIIIMARFGVSFKTVSGGPIFVSEMSMDSVYKGSKFSNDKDYMQKRQLFIDTEAQERVGGEIVMNLDEKALNNRILAMKKKEYDAAHYQGGSFAPQINFLQSKPLYEKSDIFKLIQKMPKGGALHLHDVSITDVNWLVGNVTYRDHCYMCNDVNANDSIVFHFFQNPPSNPGCPWKLVNDVRAKSNNVTAFDQMLLESMVMTPDLAVGDINMIWKAFEGALIRAEGLIFYKPVFKDYFYEALTEFQADNVQYMELRALLPEVYELNGTIIAPRDVMQIYKDTIEEFKHDNHDFTGAKIIKTNIRFFNNSFILDDIKTSVELLAAFPEHFAGYDLVGQEDPGRTLLSYLDDLLYPSTLDPPVNLPYFFHAGETTWQGTKVDDNLVDAVLLNTSRIGHGYAATKHPEVLKVIRNNKIAIEINPISNQVLKLVDNLQNHPGAALLAGGYPVVISSDDPVIWGATGLSYDFFAAFMALAGQDDGLPVLKQLAMNSLIYSAMTDAEKVVAIKAWEVKWNAFVRAALHDTAPAA